MPDVDLYTRDRVFVARVNVPSFDPMADVVLWGSRTFVKWARNVETGRQAYREGFAYVVIDQAPVGDGS